MDEQTNGQTNKRRNGRTNGRMDKQTDGKSPHSTGQDFVSYRGRCPIKKKETEQRNIHMCQYHRTLPGPPPKKQKMQHKKFFETYQMQYHQKRETALTYSCGCPSSSSSSLCSSSSSPLPRDYLDIENARPGLKARFHDHSDLFALILNNRIYKYMLTTFVISSPQYGLPALQNTDQLSVIFTA